MFTSSFLPCLAFSTYFLLPLLFLSIHFFSFFWLLSLRFSRFLIFLFSHYFLSITYFLKISRYDNSPVWVSYCTWVDHVCPVFCDITCSHSSVFRSCYCETEAICQTGNNRKKEYKWWKIVLFYDLFKFSFFLFLLEQY